MSRGKERLDAEFRLFPTLTESRENVTITQAHARYHTHRMKRAVWAPNGA